MKQLVDGKEIVMLIGMTGSGKSLTTNFLRGAQIREVRIKGKLKVLDAFLEKGEKCTVGHKADSQTLFL